MVVIGLHIGFPPDFPVSYFHTYGNSLGRMTITYAWLMYLNTNCYFTLLIGPFSTRIHWFLSTSSANRSAGSTSQVSHVFLFYQGYHVSTINGRKEKTGKEVHSESGTSRTELTLDSRSLGLFTPGHMPIEATSNTNHFSFALCLSFWVRFPSRFV